MSRAKDLHHLQLLDREGDSKRRRLAEVERALNDSAALELARRQLSDATVAAHKCTAQQTDLELALQGLVDRIARKEGQLYSGAVKNPKQLEELQQELASLRRREQKIEDNLLTAMIESEDADQALADARAGREATGISHEAKQAKLDGERISLGARLAEIEQQRASALNVIGAGHLATYEALRRRKGGLAVAIVRGDACAACGVAVSANRKWHLREGDLVHCGNCERIMVLL